MANIVRHDPFHDAMSRMFDEGFFKPFLTDFEEGLLPLDVSQDEKDIIVRASLPGFRKEEIDVQVENGVLSIKASRNATENSNGERYYRRERRMTSLNRRVALPGKVKESDTTAELKDGVLILRVPIAEDAKPKQIEIR